MSIKNLKFSSSEITESTLLWPTCHCWWTFHNLFIHFFYYFAFHSFTLLFHFLLSIFILPATRARAFFSSSSLHSLIYEKTLLLMAKVPCDINFCFMLFFINIAVLLVLHFVIIHFFSQNVVMSKKIIKFNKTVQVLILQNSFTILSAFLEKKIFACNFSSMIINLLTLRHPWMRGEKERKERV